ncbi:hypothetical protein LTR22_009052 [Elasticomyces elasticus]|nr:hypothetical protein LTR22_009052 [Elasticomyces elasticus]KAK4929193.1 hypothetical protein LTR49_004090 [Elasticomyces elasticus]KAK5765749.1 hypothetical protein LTS12_004009 [Elasticomyces elasticus]
MLQLGEWCLGSRTRSKTTKTQPVHLSDKELRHRIFVNAAILFPSCSGADAYEIVYACRPSYHSLKEPTSVPDASSWQYALLVRRTPSGGCVPLVRGIAWTSPKAPWSMVLQGLLDATAALVHRRFVDAPMPAIEVDEEALPEYQVNAGNQRWTDRVDSLVRS